MICDICEANLIDKTCYYNRTKKQWIKHILRLIDIQDVNYWIKIWIKIANRNLGGMEHIKKEDLDKYLLLK